MAEITLINDDAKNRQLTAELIFTDPPYDMSASILVDILQNYSADHLIILTTMKQFIHFSKLTDWQLSFDFVIDGLVPKKAYNIKQPNYTHHTGAYLTRPGVKSVFDRKLRPRSDVFESNGYWPTIFHAPRENIKEHGLAKNQQVITDILGSFHVNSVIDPFAGSGTTGIAAYELGLTCTLIEKDKTTFYSLVRKFKFLGNVTVVQEGD